MLSPPFRPGFGMRVPLACAPYFLSVFALGAPRRQPTGQICKVAHRSHSPKGMGEYARVALGLADRAGWSKVAGNLGEHTQDSDGSSTLTALKPCRGRRLATQRGHAA